MTRERREREEPARESLYEMKRRVRERVDGLGAEEEEEDIWTVAEDAAEGVTGCGRHAGVCLVSAGTWPTTIKSKTQKTDAGAGDGALGAGRPDRRVGTEAGTGWRAGAAEATLDDAGDEPPEMGAGR